MKQFLGFLLAVMVAVAASTPCCTGEPRPGDGAGAKQHDTRRGDDGCSCSPFFACATCTGFVSLEQPVTLVIPVAEYLPYFDHTIHYYSSVYVPVPWQPPRSV